MSNVLSFYVHIPFCKAKCAYCDFISFAGREDAFEAYTNAMINEINQWHVLGKRPISSVFIGGGTPTVLPAKHLAAVMDALFHYNITETAEITVEANPGTLTPALLKDLKAMGVNRLSIGLQATHDRLLRRIGRIHTFNEFLENYEHALAAGFSNINIDLMFGLPGQTIADWAQTLQTVVSLNPSHISAYSLILEPGTPLGDSLPEPSEADEAKDRRMYKLAKDALASAGFKHYEISNFARADFYSRHNVYCWQRQEYIGFGLSAHSFFENRRFANGGGLDAYIRADGLLSNRSNSPPLTENDAMSEFMFLGLRLMEGVSSAGFRASFNRDIFSVFGVSLKKHLQSGLLQKDGERFCLTDKGIDLSNIVLADFLLAKS